MSTLRTSTWQRWVLRGNRLEEKCVTKDETHTRDKVLNERREEGLGAEVSVVLLGKLPAQKKQNQTVKQRPNEQVLTWWAESS